MIRKYEIINKICENGIVAVVRAENELMGLNVAKACVDGGIKAIEVTFTVPGAELIIKELTNNFQMDDLIVGAGTVLDSETARIAILNGAQYIVSPGFNLDTVKLCNRYQIPYLAGCMTISEILTAMEAGVDLVKIFPGSTFGPEYIKAIKGPLPQANLMPTGGVSLENIEEWIKAGCVAVGVGGDLTAPAKIGDYKAITEIAKQFVEKVERARQK